MLDLKEKYLKCIFCENYYGPCYDEPLCLTCHLFIFPNIIEQESDSAVNFNKLNSFNIGTKLSYSFTDNLLNSSNLNSISMQSGLNNINLKFSRNFDQKLELNDSGNEDSDDQQINNQTLSILCNFALKKHEQTQANIQLSINNNDNNINNNNYKLELDKNLNREIKLNDRNDIEKNVNKINSNFIDKLPNEVLLSIFLNLDDLSLWSASQVCKRWFELIKQEISQEKWKFYISERWMFCKPIIKIDSYQDLYSQLVQSSNCFYCLHQIHNRPKLILDEELKRSWRHKRLLLELKSLQQDPPDGINAKPLDSSCYYWQASITGPVGSPYEGGIFYLYLKIPSTYPLNPPLVRFITKIYHPNISRHGDIGLDSIHENWSLALTISKVLISIQSLLTDPYTHVCMEKEIGNLYKTNRDLYEKYAKMYTWKYAMSDFMIFNNNYNNENNQIIDNLNEYFKFLLKN